MEERKSEGQRLALSSLIVMGGFVASKAIGIVRQSLIARTFGVSASLDAYYAAFKLPELILTLVAGGAVATTFIPLFADLVARGDKDRAWRLASTALNVLLAVTGLVTLLAAAFAPWLVRHAIAPGFDPKLQALTAELMRIVLVSSLVFCASSLAMSILQAHERFLLPALADFFYDVGIICGAIFLAPRLGIHGLAMGVVLGALFHLLIQVPGLAQVRARYVPTFRAGRGGPGEGSLLQLAALMVPRILILGMFQLVFLFTTSMASQLPEGSVTAISMGWIVMQMPEVIFGMAIATAAFPAMSRLAAQGDRQALQKTVLDALRAILFLTLPSAVALLLLGRRYIAILFGSAAFDERAIAMVYQATAAFTAGLLGHAVLELAARVFYAHKNTLTPFWFALGATALNVGLCIALAPWLGHAGLALANSIAVTLQAGTLLWLGWRTRLRSGVDDKLMAGTWRAVWKLLWHAALASTAMGACIWLVTNRLGTVDKLTTSPWGNFWVALAGSAAGGGVYLGIVGKLTGLLNRDQVRALAQIAFRRKPVF